MSAGLARILLIEPQFVLRRTIVAVSRDLRVADIQEATSVEAALPLLMARRFDGLVLDIGIGEKALDLLERLRAGAFPSSVDTPVVALAAAADCAPGGRLTALGLLRAICKPFKIAELLGVLQSIAIASAPEGSRAAAPVSRLPATQPA